MKKKDKDKKTFFMKKNVKSLKRKKNKEGKDETVREIVIERDNGFNTVEVIVIIIVSVFFGIVVGCILSSSRTFGTEVSSEVQEIITTYESIVENYYGDIDKKELLDSAVSGMISNLDDPYSIFMDSTDTELFNETVDGSFVGIGVTIEYIDGSFRIAGIIEGSPAQDAGLKEDDYIVKIDGKDVKSMNLEEMSKLIKGDKGSYVSLSVIRNEEEVTFKVKREIVEVLSVSSKFVDNEIGYISIDSFASNTSEQFSVQLKQLEKQGVSSLIIDVRNNPGGRLRQVNKMLDLFFDKKTILYRIETKNTIEKVYAQKSDVRSYPVVILVNNGSASASEILASCFQENYDKATILGGVTYGKGTIQKTVELSSGASIKYTTQKWLTSKGSWINEKGVIPDVIVDQNDNNSVGEEDVQLQKAIEILKK